MVARGLSGMGAAARRFLGLMPALLAALLCLRVAELALAFPPDPVFTEVARVAGRALAGDLYALGRLLPLLFLYSLPWLLARTRRALLWGLGCSWSALALLQAALVQYFVTARVPLGADLYGYSWRDISETVGAGIRLYPVLIAAGLAALLSLWLLLARLTRHERLAPSPRATAAVFTLALAALLFGPAQLPQWRGESADAYGLRVNKSAFFLAESAAYVARSAAPAATEGAATGPVRPLGLAAAARYLDPRYPFLHAEQTPDALGEHFVVRKDAPPNLVFLIVEGLGRSFSGPDASLGSFTPFLDELASRSLYWDNFLAAQGRTFAALPSIFGSLPYGEQGFDALGAAMPAHATLLSVLRDQGYRSSFYAGTDLEFDGERAFLQRQGVDVLRERRDFGPGYAPGNDWGYADDEVVSLAIADEASAARPPFVSILQTNTTHSPYTFPGQQRYLRRFEQRLGELGVAEARRGEYRAYREIYASVLYVDDVLRRYFKAASQRAWYGHTIFIITGDHRLPEIPLADWIDRYHVPLIMYSPLLRAPLRIRSVSSDFDIAPSLLAFLAHGYGIHTPAAVTWVGSGLDLEPLFRNLHQFPMKQTKGNLVDFIDGPWLLSRDRLYALNDGLHLEPAEDEAVAAAVAARFAAFRAANAQFAHSLRLAPPASLRQLAAYHEQDRLPLQGAAPAAPAPLIVREVRSPGRARAGQLAIDAVFTNSGTARREQFVPLVILQTADGKEIVESYGAAVSLDAGQSIDLHLPVRSGGLASGRYFLAVVPSDPASGKRMGTGHYRIPVVVDE
jgi:phosphoglycerol transferase MdoB-like AlkP superfamily enzyme